MYANYGAKEDFETLERLNISLKDAVVIVRYGGLFRGLKVSQAESAGAVGVLIYSDPAEDGSITLENGHLAYPDGPARQPSSVQRGSVQALSLYPGDPLTPGTPSYKNAKRLPRDAPGLSIPGIPSLPISYVDALPLLASLNGRGAQPEGFEGGLVSVGVQYFTGPGEGAVELDNHVAEKIKPAWFVAALARLRLAELTRPLIGMSMLSFQDTSMMSWSS